MITITRNSRKSNIQKYFSVELYKNTFLVIQRYHRIGGKNQLHKHIELHYPIRER